MNTTLIKKKANEIVNSFIFTEGFGRLTPADSHEPSASFVYKFAKKCALVSVSIEYTSLREQLFNLKATRVIESEKTYLSRLQELIDEEKELKIEIEKL